MIGASPDHPNPSRLGGALQPNHTHPRFQDDVTGVNLPLILLPFRVPRPGYSGCYIYGFARLSVGTAVPGCPWAGGPVLFCQAPKFRAALDGQPGTAVPTYSRKGGQCRASSTNPAVCKNAPSN